MVSVMAVLLSITAVYIAVLLWAGHKESERLRLIGPLLMVRTGAGKRTLNRIAKNRHWGRIADVFVALTVVAGLLMVVLVVWQNTLLFTHTEAVRQEPPQVEQALAIPGVNPAIPIGYGIFGLLVALVIHEGGHGVMCRFSNLKVKSLGLLFLVLPIGAFVEPDEAELQGATLREKLRMFASGPGPNMVLGAACVLLFSQAMLPALAPAHDGVALLRVSDDMPAKEAGLEEGMFVTAIDGNRTNTTEDFQEQLNVSYPDASWSWNRTAGPGSEDGGGTPVTINVTWTKGGETGTVQVTPTDKYLWYEENAPDANKESYKNKPFLGVGPADGDRLSGIIDNMISPFENQGLQGAIFYLALPFLNLQPFPTAFHDMFAITGIFAGTGTAFWVTANSLYWLFWLNVVLGTFNALPMGPLDGGHMFRHSLHTWMCRRSGIESDDLRVLDTEDSGPTFVGRTPSIQERLDDVDRKVTLINGTVGFTLLGLLLAPLVVPYFL